MWQFVRASWAEATIIVAPVMYFALFQPLLTSDVATRVFNNAQHQQWLVTGAFIGTVVFAGVFCIAALFQLHRATRLEQLEKHTTNQEGEIDELLDDLWALNTGFLVALGKKLGFSERPGQYHERITIYSYDTRGYFVPFGRYSPNPRFDSKGRAGYPEAEGRIGRAWQHGSDFANDYPNAENDVEGYVARCDEDNVPANVARNLAMKARLYYGHRVDTPDGKPLAVVMVESTDPNRFTETEIRSVFQNEEDFIRRILEKLNTRIPRAEVAQAKGL